jgi:hypothetical protein
MMALVTTKLCFSASLDSSGLFAGRKQQKKTTAPPERNKAQR